MISRFSEEEWGFMEARNGCLCYEFIGELSECSIF